MDSVENVTLDLDSFASIFVDVSYEFSLKLLLLFNFYENWNSVSK